MVINTRSKDTMKQPKLTASLDGSIVIEDSPPLTVESVLTPATGTRQKRSDPQSAAKILTPGRAHRCPPKTLFPRPTPNITDSVEAIVKTVVDDLVNSTVTTQPEDSPSTHNISRDFEDMLRDAIESPPPSPTPTPTTVVESSTLLSWYKERCVQLQRDLIAADVKYTKVHDHAASLETMVNLLNQDITEKLQEMKRLQAAVDKGRLNVSQATGIRRHLDTSKEKPTPPPSNNNLPKGTTGGKKSTPNAMEDVLKSIQAELAANRAQVHDLKKQVTDAFHSDSAQEGFTTVRSRKAKRRDPQPTPQPPPSYSDVTAGRTQKPDTISFGSSLARGTGRALRNHGVRALEYNFPGYDLEQLTEKIIPILEKNPQVTKVIVNAGGNDCEKPGVPLQHIKAQYDALVDAIKIQQGWECKVVITSVPQRRQATTETRHKIAGLNLEHYYHSDPDKFVYYVNSAPNVASYFYDRVHLNYHGLDFWARKVSSAMSTFPPTASTSRM